MSISLCQYARHSLPVENTDTLIDYLLSTFGENIDYGFYNNHPVNLQLGVEINGGSYSWHSLKRYIIDPSGPIAELENQAYLHNLACDRDIILKDDDYDSMHPIVDFWYKSKKVHFFFGLEFYSNIRNAHETWTFFRKFFEDDGYDDSWSFQNFQDKRTTNLNFHNKVSTYRPEIYYYPDEQQYSYGGVEIPDIYFNYALTWDEYKARISDYYGDRILSISRYMLDSEYRNSLKGKELRFWCFVDDYADLLD